MLDNLIQLISFSECCSGLKVNWEKLRLSGVNLDTLETAVSEKFTYMFEELPFSYLGFSLGGTQNILYFDSYN